MGGVAESRLYYEAYDDGISKSMKNHYSGFTEIMFAVIKRG